MFGRRRQNDFSAEIESHIALETDRLRSEGLSDAEARAAARRSFGNTTAAEERFYERSRWLRWDEIRKDVGYALRTLRHNPAFTLAAVLTLALGIGANTAIFSVIDMALLRPLPYPNPDTLIMLYSRYPGGNGPLAPADYLDFRRDSKSFQQLAAYRQAAYNLSGQERPERIEGAVVTPNFFAVFGVPALVGRTLSAERDGPGAARTAVLSYGLWQRRYAGRTDVIGEAVQIDGEPRTIVGVMPQYFQYPPECDAWTSARYAVPEHVLRPDLDQSNVRDSHYFFTIGRLRPGVSLKQARIEADTIARRLKQQYGKDEEADSAALLTLRDELVGETRPALLILVCAVSLLLLIACANVANILLARGATRQKEIAIRGALGASRARLMRQLFTESVTIAVGGGGLGVLFAYASLAPLRALLPEDMVAGAALKLDARVLVFTAIVSVVSAILFGLFPAQQAAALDLNDVLKESRGPSGGSRTERVRNLLVVSEVALAAVLLISAGLLIRSFSRLLAVPGGFNPERVLSLQLSLPRGRYPEPNARVRFVSQALERIAAEPGIESAAAISRLPLNPGNSTRSIDVKGRTHPAEGDVSPDYLVVSPAYFRTMDIRLTKGRTFTERDDAKAAPVVIVSEATARHFWPGQDPVGQFVQVGACGNEKDWCEVVGVVEDIHQHNLDGTARPAVYVPYARDPWPFMAFVVRTRTVPQSAASAVEAAIRWVDKDEPVYNVRTMEEVVSGSLSPRRTRTALLGLFALLALALACVGIYGVMAYSVAQRAHEIGIRVALGADRTHVLGLVVRQTLGLCLTGLCAGVLLSLALTRFLSNLLYGVQATDMATFLGTSILLILMALLASSIPAWRALRVDPMVSLRAQ